MTRDAIAERLRALAAEDVPKGSDLWSRIQAGVWARRRRRVARRATWATAVAALCALLVVLPFTALAGENAAGEGWQRFRQRFGFILVEQTPPAPPPTPPRAVRAPVALPATPVSAGSAPLPLLSLPEAEAAVGYPIHAPSWLPAELRLRGAFVGGEQVALSYVTPDAPNAGMGVQQYPGTAVKGGFAVPAERIEEVRVGDVPAVYVKGSWDERNQWVVSAPAAKLSWVRDGRVYIVQYSGLDLSREDLIRVAESIP